MVKPLLNRVLGEDLESELLAVDRVFDTIEAKKVAPFYNLPSSWGGRVKILTTLV
jgi:hypothetical protein